MSTTSLQVFVAVFDDEQQAGQALQRYQAMEREGSIELVDAAVIVRTRDGNVRIEETAGASGRKWAKRGAIAGGLAGLIFPPSIVISAVVGAGGGGIWGKIRDRGFKGEDLEAIAEGMTPGTSAVMAIADERSLEHLQSGLSGYTRTVRHTLSAEAASAIDAELAAREQGS